MTKKNTDGKYTRRLWALQFTNLYDRKTVHFVEAYGSGEPQLFDTKTEATKYMDARHDLTGIVGVIEVVATLTPVVKKKAVAKKKPRIINELMVTGRILSIDFHHDCGMCCVFVKSDQGKLDQAVLETVDVLNVFFPDSTGDAVDLIRVTKYTDAGGPEITYRLVRTGSVKINAKKLGT